MIIIVFLDQSAMFLINAKDGNYISMIFTFSNLFEICKNISSDEA